MAASREMLYNISTLSSLRPLYEILMPPLGLCHAWRYSLKEAKCSIFFTSPLRFSFSCFAGRSRSRAIGCEDLTMDYLLAGITALFLFGYLIYALLRPEKF